MGQGSVLDTRGEQGLLGGAPVIDEYVYKQYENAQAMIEALKNGEIDYAYTTRPTSSTR